MYYFTENAVTAFDGWTIEVNINGGAWNNIRPTMSDPNPFTLNGYNATISPTFASDIAGQPAFSMDARVWTETRAVIPTLAGDNVSIRFRMASDNAVAPAGTGVWIDDVCIGNAHLAGAGESGVCCRGSTCNATVARSQCSLSGLAGAMFVATPGACNAPGVTATPCCHADFNKVGGITLQDVFDFLNGWFAGSIFARVGGDGAGGTLDVQNVFDFLNAWFAGGC